MPAKMELEYYQKLPIAQLKQLIEELTQFRASVSNRAGKQWCDDFIEMLNTVLRARHKK